MHEPTTPDPVSDSLATWSDCSMADPRSDVGRRALVRLKRRRRQLFVLAGIASVFTLMLFSFSSNFFPEKTIALQTTPLTEEGSANLDANASQRIRLARLQLEWDRLVQKIDRQIHAKQTIPEEVAMSQGASEWMRETLAQWP